MSGRLINSSASLSWILNQLLGACTVKVQTWFSRAQALYVQMMEAVQGKGWLLAHQLVRYRFFLILEESLQKDTEPHA